MRLELGSCSLLCPSSAAELRRVDGSKDSLVAIISTVSGAKCQVSGGARRFNELETGEVGSLRRHYPDQVVRVSPDVSEDSQPFQRLPSDNQTLGRLVQRVNELCCGGAGG